MKRKLISAVIIAAFLLVSLILINNQYKEYENPPVLNIYCDDIMMKLNGSAFSWSFEKLFCRENYEASLVHPLDMKHGEPLFYTYGDAVELSFESQPDEITEARCWPKSAVGDTSAEGTSIDIGDGAIDPPAEGMIYEIIAKWTENKYYSGTARYVFYIEP